jgi:hypothetical protein
MKSLLLLFGFSLALHTSAGPNLSQGTLSFYIVSDTTNVVVGPDDTGFARAVATWVHPAWTASIPGATWIWDSYYVSDPANDQYVAFTNDFGVAGSVQSASLSVAADNQLWVYINGIPAGCDQVQSTYAGAIQCDVTPYVFTGLNVITFQVKNIGVGGSNGQTNPGGLLYKLKVTSAFSR